MLNGCFTQPFSYYSPQNVESPSHYLWENTMRSHGSVSRWFCSERIQPHNNSTPAKTPGGLFTLHTVGKCSGWIPIIPQTLSLLWTFVLRIHFVYTRIPGKVSEDLFKGPLLYCFSSIYYRSQIYTKHVSEVFGSKHQTDHCSITHNPLCFSPGSKELILCLLL